MSPKPAKLITYRCMKCLRRSLFTDITCPVCKGAMEKLCEKCSSSPRLPHGHLCGDCLAGLMLRYQKAGMSSHTDMKWEMLQIAEGIAEEEHDTDFYDLDESTRASIWQRAEQHWQEQQCTKADMLDD